MVFHLFKLTLQEWKSVQWLFGLGAYLSAHDSISEHLQPLWAWGSDITANSDGYHNVSVFAFFWGGGCTLMRLM